MIFSCLLIKHLKCPPEHEQNSDHVLNSHLQTFLSDGSYIQNPVHDHSLYTCWSSMWEWCRHLWLLSYCLLWLGSEIVRYECVSQHLSDTWYHIIPTHHWQLNKTFPLIHHQLCSCCIESALLSHKMLPGAIIKCFIVCRANNLSKLL